jgi:hypothetical protein
LAHHSGTSSLGAIDEIVAVLHGDDGKEFLRNICVLYVRVAKAGVADQRLLWHCHIRHTFVEMPATVG